MCLSAYGENAKKKRACRDIPIFKIVCDDNTSYYQKFRYQLGSIYKTRLAIHPVSVSDRTDLRVHDGFHSYRPEEVEVEYTDYLGSCVCIFEKEKDFSDIFYGTRGSQIGNYYDKAYIAKGYIPKNSTYIADGHGCIVSTRICLTESYPVAGFLNNDVLNAWIKQ